MLHQIKLSAIEARLFAAFSRRRIFDVDDAIYVRKPRRLGDAPDESPWRKKKFAATCRWVDVVAAGNDVLAGVARAAAQAVVDFADLDRHGGCIGRRPPTAADPPTIAWIGSPENLVYLEMIRPALARLAARHPTLKLRVICSQFPDWPEVNIERIAWSSATEAQSLAAAHIGVMPLTDDAWARGKCAFKLLQYMAAALPCVASPVGANTEAVIDGFNGFHARTVDEWERSWSADPIAGAARALRCQRARARRTRYAMRAYQARYVELLTRLAAGPTRGLNARSAEAGILCAMQAMHIYQILNHYTAARKTWIRDSRCWITRPMSGPIGSSIGRSGNSC